MATNIEQIFRSFVVNKFKEIQEEGKLDSENSENSQNGELTVQKEEHTSESMPVCLQSEGTAPTCQDETMKTENLELAKAVTIETDSTAKELKSAELTSDDEVKRDSSKKKSKKHKKHKSKKKKKKKKKEKHEKRSKSVSSVEDQENVTEIKSVWKPAFSSPAKEQILSDALPSITESRNTVVLSSVNTQESTSSSVENTLTGLQLDPGFFGPKCPNELSKNISLNSETCNAEINEQCEASALATQQSKEPPAHIENTSEFAETQQSSTLVICSQAKSPEVNSQLEVNSGKDSINPSERSGSLSNCEKRQKSKEKSQSSSRSKSLEKVPKSLETSTKSPKSRQRSVSRDQRKKSRSSSVGRRRRSTSRSPGRRRRSRSARYSKSPIRNWWSKSIRNRRRSVSMVKRHRSRTRSSARRRKSRSRSAENRHCSRTRSRSASRQRKSRSFSRKYKRKSKSASNNRTRSKSVKRRYSKSGSVSRTRRSRSYSISRRRRSRSGSAAKRQRSRSASASKRQKSKSVSPARRRRSRSASPARRRSRSASPVKRQRSRLASPARRRKSRSASSARRRRSRSVSPIRSRRSRSASPARRRRSRSVSPIRRRRSRSASPARRRRSRSASPARRRRSRSASPARRRRSRSASPARRRRSRSASPAKRRKSASPARRRRSSSVCRRSKSAERQKMSVSSAVKRQRSRSGSDARGQSTVYTSAARKDSRPKSPSTANKPSETKLGKSRSRSGSVRLKRRSRSVEKEHRSRSKSPSSVRISGLTPLNKMQPSTSPTVSQTKPASSSETITNQSKLPEMNSESLNETICLEKTDTPLKLIQSSNKTAQEVCSNSVSEVSNQNIFDSSFKAPSSDVSYSQFKPSGPEKNEAAILPSASISEEPFKPADTTSLDCTQTSYEKLQSSLDGSKALNDKVSQHESANTGSEKEKPFAANNAESSDVFEPTTCDQYSMDSELELANQALHSNYTSLEPESNFSYLSSACVMTMDPSPAETVQSSSDRKYFESDNHQLTNDGIKLDSIISPSTSTVSCKEAVPEYPSQLYVQDTLTSHSDKSNIGLHLVHPSLHHASLTSNIISDESVRPYPLLATNNTSLESTSNQSEIQKKGQGTECSQEDTNCNLKDKDESTPYFGLSSRDTVVLHNSTDTVHTTLFTDQSSSVMSEQACSEKIKNIEYLNTTESLSGDNFASRTLADQNLSGTYDECDLLTSTEREQSSVHYINKHPEKQAEMPKCQSRLEEELSVSPPKTQLYDMFSNSQDQTDNLKKSAKSPDSHRSFTDGASSYKQVLEHSGLQQALYSSPENVENVSAASIQYAVSSTDSSAKELHETSENCKAIAEDIKIEQSCSSNTEIDFKDNLNMVASLSGSHGAEISTISAGVQDLEGVSNKEKLILICEAKQESGSSGISNRICPEVTMNLIPEEIPSQMQQMDIQITDTLSETVIEQTDGELCSLSESCSFLFSSNNQNLDNTAKCSTTNKNEDIKDHGSTLLLASESKDDKVLTEGPFGLDKEAANYSQKKITSPYTAMDSASSKQNSSSQVDDKLDLEKEINTEPVSELEKKVDLEARTRNYGKFESASYTVSSYVSSNLSEVQSISKSVVQEAQKPPMPVQFKFSKTFKTLASSQLCNTSDESSDKETSKVSLSHSAKASASSHVESSRTNAKSPQNVLHLKQRDASLPEALPPESLSNAGSGGKDALQQDVNQTEDMNSSAAVKHAFPHISGASSKLGVKQRQYRSRSVAQDSRSPSADRRPGSRSRSKSRARKRRSRSKSVSRKKRSQSSSRKKSSHSKSAKNKRSRSKSRGRKRRSQSKSKSKKKHSPSKSSGKRKRSRSKSSERVASLGKPESSRSKSKTRRKGAHTNSPSSSRRSRSKSTRSKNFDARKTSRSGSSRSRSRSISLSRRHLSHSKPLHRKNSRSSSKSTSPRKRSLSRNQGRSFSRSPARRHRSRSKSHTRRRRSRSRGRWRRSLSSSRKRSRSSSRTSGTLSTKKRRSISKSPLRDRRSRSQAKLKEKSPVTKSISPLPQKKTTQSKAAPFKPSIGLKSLIQKQLSQAKSQGSGGKMSKEQIPLSTIAARAQLPAANFSTRAQVSAPSLNIVSQISVPNLAEVPLPSENGNGQIPVPNFPPEQQISVASIAPEASLPVPDLTTATPWHVPDTASGAQWPVPDIAAGTQWPMSDLTAGAQWPMADLTAGSHWPMHDLGVGTQWSVPDLAAGTSWAVPDVATGAQWTVPDLTASTQWTVPDLTAGSQWAMTNLASGAQWAVPDLAPTAQWTVPDLTSGTHIQSADLAPEAQVPGSDVTIEAQVPGSDLATEAQVPGSDLTAEAQVPRSDLVGEAQVPVPEHIPDNLVAEGHNPMPDVTAEALVPVASGTLVPDVAAGIPLPDVTAAAQTPVPDVAVTTSIPVPDVATTAHSYVSDYASYGTVHASVFENTAKPSIYLDMNLTAGELADSSFANESLLSAKKTESEALNRTEDQTALESVPSTDQPSELPLNHGTVPEIPASLLQEQISSEHPLKSEPCNISNSPLFDPCLRSEVSSLIVSPADKSSSPIPVLFESHRDLDCQLSVNDVHADSSQIHESRPSPVQSYISPNHTTLVDPYRSPDNNLIEPYSSPDRPILVSEYSDSDCQLMSEPDTVPGCPVVPSSCVSSEHSPIVEVASSHARSHQELNEQNVSLDHLQQHEPSAVLLCPESADHFAKPNYAEQDNTYVSACGEILGDERANPDIPQLVEPYGSPEHPELVEPYASPEQPQLVEPYASPECPQLVEPYASPEHPLLVEPYGSPDSQGLVESDVSQEHKVVQSLAGPKSAETVQSCTSLQCPQLVQAYDSQDHQQLDQPFADAEQTQLVQQISSSESFTSLQSSHAIQSCANSEDVQPYTDSEQNLDHPFANSKPMQLEPLASSEHPQVVQSVASTDCPQLVQPYDSPEHPQLLQPYKSPEHSQLVESYGRSEHLQQDPPYESPEHQQPILPFDSVECSELVHPYVAPQGSQLDQSCNSPKHSQLVQPHAGPEHPQLDKLYASPIHSCPKEPHASPKIKLLAQPYTSPEQPQLPQTDDSQKHPLLVQPYDSPEHMQLVQPCASTEHPQLVESYASPEHSQLTEPYSSVDDPQLDETYCSPYHSQHNLINSNPDLSLNLGSSCHDDIGENCKLAQSPVSDSRFDNPLLDKFDKTGPILEAACSSLLQKHKTSPKSIHPVLEQCHQSSYKISSELFDAAPKSPHGNSSECPIHLGSKDDYIDSNQYLDCNLADSTQQNRSTSNSQLKPDQSGNFHQQQSEKSLLDKRHLHLEVQCAVDGQQLEKELSPVDECVISNQPQIFAENTNLEENSSSSISCLDKASLSNDQILSVDLVNEAGQALGEENDSSTVELLKDPCLDLANVAYPQVIPVKTVENPELPIMPLLDRVISNDEPFLTVRNMSSFDTYFEDRAVPSVEQEQQSDRFEGDTNSTEQQLTEESTVIFACGPPDKLTSQSEVPLDNPCSSPLNLPQNVPLDNYSYPHSENKSNKPSQSLEQHHDKETPWNDEHSGMNADYSKNDLSEPTETTIEGSTSDMKSHLLSSQQVCDKPVVAILSAENDDPCTNLSLQTQDKVDRYMSVQASTLPVESEAHVIEDSGDKVQIEEECKITPPDLLPFDSEQPTSMCLNSESSSEPVLFISQPPPELLPYDSEQPANHFQNISDYSSEQDSLAFHTPPELLPYDSDQTTMLVSKPEYYEEELSIHDPTDASEKSSAVFVSSENPRASQDSLTIVEKETLNVQPASAGATDISEMLTKESVCVKHETSTSSILLQGTDITNSEMLVEQPVSSFFNAEFGQELPSSKSTCHETKGSREEPCLDEITTPHRLSEKEHSIEHSQLREESVKSTPSVSTAEIKQPSLIVTASGNSVVQPCFGNSELINFSEQKKASVAQSHIALKVSNECSRSKSLSKTELAHSLSTSTKHDSPSKSSSRPARSHSRSKDRRKSRSKSTTKKKRSRSKSVTRVKKSRSKSLIKTRKSRSKSVTVRKKSRSVSDTRYRRSRSRSVSRKRRSRSTSVTHKKTSRSPSAAHRRRSRSSRRKHSRSTSVDHKRAHSHSVARRRRSRSLSIARRRHTRSRSPVRKKRSRSSSLHRRKRSRSSSVARRRRSRSNSINRRRRSRSSSVSRRRYSPLQTATRRRRSPSLGRRRRSRSLSLAHRRRSRSASRRRRSRSPSASRRRRSPSAPRRRRSRSPSPLRRKRSSSGVRKRRSHSTSAAHKRLSRSSSASRKRRSRSSSNSRKRHSRTPTVASKKRSESKSPTPKSPKTKPRAQSKSDRSRSRSQSNIIRKRKTRSRSSSRDQSKSTEKRRKRSSSKDHYSVKQRRKSRTPQRRKKSRSPARRVSPCRSPVRRRRSRSPVRRKSFSRSPVRRKRSRSRDQSMDCARSPKRLTDLDKAQLLEIAKANAAAMCAKAGVPLPPSLKPVLTPSAPVDEKVTHRTYGVTIQELTEKCKQIAQSKEDDEVVNKPHDSDEDEDDKPFYNHPFKVSEHKPISFSLLNPSLKPAPKNQVTLTKEFPVSSGSQHRKKESDKVYGEWVPVDKKTEESKDDVFTNTGPSQPVDITAAMNERAMAQTRLTGNPFDLEALLMLNRAQEQIDAWAQSTSLPGQFTGSTGAQVLSADEISNSGPQAWLKKDQFLKAAPVTGGRGALLMRKMGWKEGEGLGRNNEGNVNPILVDFKTDRKGLVADGEKASNKLTLPVIKDLSGKHPISVLMELCNKKKWSPPDFTLVDDTGPDHRKRFLFKVTVNGVTCQPSQPSVTKKLAKATAAAAALQALGALPKENITSTTNFCSASTSTV